VAGAYHRSRREDFDALVRDVALIGGVLKRENGPAGDVESFT
jgi:hypothetical protein